MAMTRLTKWLVLVLFVFAETSFAEGDRTYFGLGGAPFHAYYEGGQFHEYTLFSLMEGAPRHVNSWEHMPELEEIFLGRPLRGFTPTCERVTVSIKEFGHPDFLVDQLFVVEKSLFGSKFSDVSFFWTSELDIECMPLRLLTIDKTQTLELKRAVLEYVPMTIGKTTPRRSDVERAKLLVVEPNAQSDFLVFRFTRNDGSTLRWFVYSRIDKRVVFDFDTWSIDFPMVFFRINNDSHLYVLFNQPCDEGCHAGRIVDLASPERCSIICGTTGFGKFTTQHE